MTKLTHDFEALMSPENFATLQESGVFDNVTSMTHQKRAGTGDVIVQFTKISANRNSFAVVPGEVMQVVTYLKDRQTGVVLKDRHG